MLPLEFTGQPAAGPGRKRVSLVVADVGNRRGRINGLRPAQRHRPVAVLALLPIKRRAPAFRLHRRPSGGEPEQGRPVAAVGHELHPLRIGDKAIREFKRFDQRTMPRPLAIEGEAFAVVSDFHYAAIELPIGRRRAIGLADRNWAWIFVSRTQRVLREQVQDIGQQQFLMLLFMIAAEFDQFGDGRRQVFLHERGHRAVDMIPVRSDRLERRAGDHAPSWTRLTSADALIVGVEQEIELRIERAVAGEILFQNHSLEKPCRMREMPFCRARIGHRLHGRVGVGQWRAEASARFANRLIVRAEIGVSLHRTMGHRYTHAVLVLFVGRPVHAEASHMGSPSTLARGGLE